MYEVSAQLCIRLDVLALDRGSGYSSSRVGFNCGDLSPEAEKSLVSELSAGLGEALGRSLKESFTRINRRHRE